MNYVFDLYNVFAKTAADTARQLTDINARTYEKLVKRQIELTSDLMESGIKQTVSHYMSVQKQLAEEYADKAQKANKDTVKIITQAQDELNSYLEEKLPVTMEEVRSAVKDVTKDAADTTRSAASKKAA
ncbi:MAG TPA: phasin family protein [Gammaproteobacteria bacterium]|nr:phasin family protein [Gammaproteobacteria bacterium]